MVINYLITILDREKEKDVMDIYNDAGLAVILTVRGQGTATSEHLNHYGLEATKKSVITAVATEKQTAGIIKSLRRKLFIDVPGNGIVVAVPLKSVGGVKTLAYITNDAPVDKTEPKLTYSHELIMVMSNQSYSDEVMFAARQAGAFGGTIIHAKGTGEALAKKFFEVSLASEKELIMIVANAATKSAIMKSIADQCGPSTPAGAICFSLPVSEVAGLREQLPD